VIAGLLAAAALLAGAAPAVRAAEPAAGTPNSSPLVVSAAAFGGSVWGPLLYGSADSTATQLAKGPSGSVYSVVDVGVSWGPDHCVMSVARIRVSDGHVLWRKAYAGPGPWASATRVVAAPNGDAIVLGYQRPAADAGASWFVRRYRASTGRVLWSRTRSSGDVAGKPTDTTAYGLAVDDGGNVYVAGTTLNSNDSPGVAIAAKYTASGRPAWTRRLESGAGGNLNGIAVDAHRNSYVTGCVMTDDGPPIVAVGVVTRLSSGGRVVWSKPIGNHGFFQTTQPIVRGTRLFVRGLEWVSDPPNVPFGWPLVAKVSTATGRRVWTTQLDAIPGRNQQPQGLAIDAAGNAVISGGSQYVELADEPNVQYMGWVYKLSAGTGAPAWHRWLFNDLGTESYSGWVGEVAIDGRGRVYAAGGWNHDATAQGSDGIVVRYAASGGSRKLWRFTGDATGWGTDCRTVIVAGGAVVAAGSLEMSTGQKSFVRRLRP
jgi:hypothetical protein